VSRWDPDAGTFLVSAGMGQAQLVDRAQYPIEIDPKVDLLHEAPSYYGARESEIVQATCKGTIKNISNHELGKLEAECRNEVIDEEKTAKAKLKPDKLAANASGKYELKLPIADSGHSFIVTITSDSNRMPYLNAFAYHRNESILATAVKVQADTGLAYMSSG